MKKVFLIFITLIFLTVPCQIFINAEEPTQEFQRLRRLVNTGNPDEIINLLDNAKNDGLPVDGLLNKAREGAAKQVDVNLIIDVLQNKTALLKKAKEILSQGEQRGLRVWDNNRKPSIESIASSLEEGLDEKKIEKIMNDVISNNEDADYLIQSTSSYSTLLKAKLSRDLIEELITLAVEKRIYAYNFNDITEFLIEAKQYDYPLPEVVAKLKQGIIEGRDIRGVIFDIKFSR